jgi:hypothetical protein
LECRKWSAMLANVDKITQLPKWYKW